MTENLTIAWLKEPEAKDYPAALSYLSLLYDEAVAQSRDRPAASGSLGVQGEGRAQGLRSPTSGRQQSTRGEGPEENPRGTGAVSANFLINSQTPILCWPLDKHAASRCCDVLYRTQWQELATSQLPQNVTF